MHKRNTLILIAVTAGLLLTGALTQQGCLAQFDLGGGQAADNSAPPEGIGGPPPLGDEGGPSGQNGDPNGMEPDGQNSPGGPGDSGGPGGPGGPGGNSSSKYPITAVFTVDGKTVSENNKQVSSDKQDVSGILVKNGGALTLNNPKVTTTGQSSSNDASSFYGLDSGVIAQKGSTVTINGGSISTTGQGANALFASGQGAEAIMTGGSVHATGDGGHGVMATLGGTLKITNVNVVTERTRAGAIATDRGGGTIDVIGGKVVTYGSTSPAVYSTGNITVTNGDLNAVGAELGVIEGSNSIILNNTVGVGTLKCGFMIYQSFSGDAEGQSGKIEIKGGSITAKSGPLFLITNTNAFVKVTGAKLVSDAGKLITAGANRWGRTGSNGGHLTFIAEKQVLLGDVQADKISSINLSLKNSSSLDGGVSYASIVLDGSSKWSVSKDSTLVALTDPAVSGTTITNIVGNGHTVTYDAAQDANRWLGGKTYKLAGGGQLSPQQ